MSRLIVKDGMFRFEYDNSLYVLVEDADYGKASFSPP